MSQAVKWWKSIKFWQRTGLLLSPLAAGGEIALVVNDAPTIWHVVMVASTAIVVYATKIFTDNDNDGVVDQLQ